VLEVALIFPVLDPRQQQAHVAAPQEDAVDVAVGHWLRTSCNSRGLSTST
jgi:hypothetical protein